jgi:hypothetical protein
MKGRNYFGDIGIYIYIYIYIFSFLFVPTLELRADLSVS